MTAKLEAMLTRLAEEVATIKMHVQEVHEMRKDITTISEDIASVKDSVHRAIAESGVALDQSRRALEQSQANTEVVTRLQNRVTQLELYSRKLNLIFNGVPQPEGSTSLQCVNDILQTKLQLQPSTVNIVECHPVGISKPDRPRSIYCRFASSADKSLVLRSVGKLKGTRIVIKEDFPPEIVERRKILLPIFKSAREKKLRVKLSADNLFINNTLYTVSNLDQLPVDLQPKNEIGRGPLAKDNQPQPLVFG